ncbi:unnamed protein product [Lymnaea stagnalis]|uniref:Uncharacterized protein n=1 Tax=Lymnaea stagnalis TaxID=6523 RepID=A0AAV2HKI0_LYMST
MNGHNLSDKHECSAYLDKEIIKKLLEVDDITEKEHSLHLASSNFKEPSKFHSSGLVPNSFPVQGKNFNTNSSNSSTHWCSSSASPTGAQNLLCGWFVDPKVVCRGSESGSAAKGKSNSFNHNVLLSRDSGKSHKKSVFRHYSDPRAYIEQYRQENKCNSVTKFEPSESQSSSFYEPPLLRRSAYQQISAPSTLQHNSVDSNSNRTNQLQRDQAVKKEYQKKTISANFLNNLHLYKLSHNFEKQLESSPEQKSNAVEKSIIRDNERAGNPENTVVSTPSLNSISVQKIHVSKLNLSSPSSSSEMSSLNLSRTQSPSAPTGSIVTNQFLSRKIGSPTSQPRGLDPLVWTSGKSEKQICGAQDFNNRQDHPGVAQDHPGVAHKNKTVPTQTPRPSVNKLPDDNGGKEVCPHLASLVKTSYKNQNVVDLTYKSKCKDYMALSCTSKCKDVSALITGVLNLQYSFQEREMTIMAI